MYINLEMAVSNKPSAEQDISSSESAASVIAARCSLTKSNKELRVAEV